MIHEGYNQQGPKMNDSPKRSIRSRCTGVCRLNADRVCIGCHRDAEQISAWADASTDDREEINCIAALREQRMTRRPA
ncbi:MAG TPA: DUF1289 domain-containing protein [Rhodopirellula sp.]|nr:MAG: hypothetical protein CBD74_00865 [Saprospirales bacterium TMED214]HBV61489.1 DUF1289 domain-containing protein [Rhodopirellula sp.]